MGTTRLVCALYAEDHLAIVAIEVIQAAEEEMTTIEKSLEEFEGVEAFRHPDRGTVSLQHDVRGAASSLTKAQVRTAVVHVNATAEHLLLMKK